MEGGRVLRQGGKKKVDAILAPRFLTPPRNGQWKFTVKMEWTEWRRVDMGGAVLSGS